MLLKLYEKNNNPKDLDRIIETLQAGGLIIYPTDTMYAIGCHGLNTGNRLPKIFRNRKEVGIRIPDNNIIREICRLLDAPILTTTLPLEEGEEIEYITTPELIEEKFGNQVDLVIDGGIGGIEPSTIVDCTNEEAEIVRQGKGILNE